MACLQIVKSNTAFDLPREKLKQYFSRADLFFSRDTHLCFVCGAAGDIIPDTGHSSLRAMFIDHVAQRGDSKIVCVRAETAATELLRQIDERGQNISTFEKTIAETVDSVLIFPESPGSFAELGYFSAHDAIARKTLVAVRTQHQANSFITLGPVHAISRVSLFAPSPIALGDPPAAQMPQIAERLLGDTLTKRTYRQRFEKQTWKGYDSRHQLAILDEIIDLVGATTETDLRHAVSECFGPYDVSIIRLQLAILVATVRVARNDNGDIFSRARTVPFIEANSQETLAMKATWRRALEQHDPTALSELEGIRK